MRICFFLPFILIYYSSFSQSVVNNGNTISVTGAQFTVGEDFTNNGTFINNGNLLISGAWINNGTYNPGTGQIIFNGTQPQIINHNDQSFKRLTISGGGEKKFLANITIENELTLQSGNLISENGAKIIIQSNALINGGSDQSHIVGPVVQKGSGLLLFPIGNVNTYLPVEINDVTDATVVAQMELHELKVGEALTAGNGVRQVSAKRFWELKLTQGSIANSTLTLPLRDEINLTGKPEFFAVAESPAQFGPYQSLGQSSFVGDVINGFLISELPPALSFFTLATLKEDKSVVAYNGISPNGDGFNDYFKILNIDQYPGNKVSIFNRWGDKVFEVDGYDNDQRIFKGNNNLKSGEQVPSGIYFYKINLGDGSAVLTGYVEIR